jgi:predicted nucleic-acid-binding protein
MITAVDTNVLLDVFLPDERFAEESKRTFIEGVLMR